MFADILNKLLIAAVLTVSLGTTTPTLKAGDVIQLDITGVDPAFQGLFTNAEAYWEQRILGYSSELPRAVQNQITKLVIVSSVEAIDGAGGVLGMAGPDGTVGIRFVNSRRPFVVAVTSSMVFDVDDLADLAVQGTLENVIIHEMGHALGIGSLWEDNGVLRDFEGLGELNYAGQYGLQGYVQDIGNPSVLFVPVEQDGGAGTAGGHWDDAPPFFNQVFTPAFTKEMMTGFLCDVDADGNEVCAPRFLANASLGSLADLGFAINGFNEQFLLPPNAVAVPAWPKTIAGNTQNQLFSAGDRAAGLRYDVRRSYISLRASKASLNGTQQQPGAQDRSGPDPYGLRNHSWAK